LHPEEKTASPSLTPVDVPEFQSPQYRIPTKVAGVIANVDMLDQTFTIYLVNTIIQISKDIPLTCTYSSSMAVQ
jgi:hypothetical protein